MRSLVGLIGTRHQSSSSLHSVPGAIGCGKGPRCSATHPCRVAAVDPLAAPPTLHIMRVVVHGIVGAFGVRPLGFCHRFIDLCTVAPFVWWQGQTALGGSASSVRIVLVAW